MVGPDPFIDLVHRELDGELSPEEGRQLQRLLATDASRREFRERLRRLHETLGRVPDLEPPADMKRRVLEATAFARPRPAARGGRDITARRETGPARSFLRLAAPLAAGLLGGAILTAWWLGGVAGSGFDPAAVSGAMGTPTAPGALLDSRSLTLDGLRARADLHAAGSGWDLVVHVESGQSTEITLVCGSDDCGIQGFAWLEGSGGEARLEARRLTVPTTGVVTLAARMEKPGKAALVEFSVDGEPRGHLVLEPGRDAGEN